MNVDFLIVFGNTCITNLDDLDSNLKHYSHEEAHLGIVLHVIDVSRRDPFTEIVVSCSDTDVFLILLHYFEEITTGVAFRTIHHDITLRFLFEAQCKLGNGYEKPTDNDLNELELFVLNLYRQKLPPNVRSLASLSWLIFSKQQAESRKLPPTREAFRQKVFRSHYTALQWKLSHLPTQNLPDPNEYGWSWNDESSTYVPIMTTLPPAPESIISLSLCRCKTNCESLRYVCRKNGLSCSEMCFCENCENEDNASLSEFDSEDEYDDI